MFPFLIISCGKISGKNSPKAVRGILNIENIDIGSSKGIRLDGEWEFYWGKLLSPEDFTNGTPDYKPDYINVPGLWDQAGLIRKEGYPLNGFATYRLVVVTGFSSNTNISLGLNLQNIKSAYKIWIRGRLLKAVGNVSDDPGKARYRHQPEVVYFNQNQKNIEIIIQTANFRNRSGGIWQPITLGTSAVITGIRDKMLGIDYFLFGSILIMSLYHFGLFLLRRKDKSTLYFGLLCLIVAIRITIGGVFLAGIWFPDFPWELYAKLDPLTVFLVIPVLLLHIESLFKKYFWHYAVNIALVFSAVCSLIVISTPETIFYYTEPPNQAFLILSCIYFLYIIIRAFIDKDKSAPYFLTASLFLLIAGINDVLQVSFEFQTFALSPAAIFFFILIQSYNLSRKFAGAFHYVETMSSVIKLNYKKTKKLLSDNQELQSLNQSKNNFIANVSHEFRTPLTLLLSPIEAIIQGEYGERINKSDPIFDAMLHNGRKLLRLINNLLDFSKIEAGKIIMHKERTDISRLLEYYVSTVKSTAEYRKLSLVFNDNSDGIIAFIDRDLIEKAVFNLISNALKFTPAGGSIIIQLDDAEAPFDSAQGAVNNAAADIERSRNAAYSKCFSITVKDSGIGIPGEKLDLIFERFAQVDSSSSRKYEGTGIGLALTKEIVELHGGKITVKSREGKGSAFTIVLPIEDSEKKDDWTEAAGMVDENINKISPVLLSDISRIKSPVSVNIKEKLTEKQQSILIVEDNIEMMDFLKIFLEKEYNVLMAYNGKEGLEITVSRKPDLILSDVMMPEMDGYEMTREIRNNEELTGIPIIFLTSKAETAMKLEGLELGAIDYIVKPFNLAELSARIKAQLDMKSLRDEAISQKKALEESIKKRETAERNYSASENRFQEMAELMPVVIADLDLNGKIRYMNRPGLDLFGIKEKINILGLEIYDFIESSDREKLKKELQRIAKEETLDLIGCKILNHEGSGINTLIKIAPLFEDDKATGCRMTIIEIKSFLEKALMPDEGFFKTYGLSERESEVLRNILKGYSNKQLRERLFISENTVKTHLKAIYQKLGISSREELFNLIKNQISKNVNPDNLMISVLNSIIKSEE